MKGIISGIKRMEIHDGDGLRTTVFFKGCSLKCIWCHNPESISFEPQIARFKEKCIGCQSCSGLDMKDAVKICPTAALTLFGTEYEATELSDILSEDIEFFKKSSGGVTFSGGECLAQPKFAWELAKLLTDKGISVNIDTSGYVKKEVLDEIIPYTDTFLYDIKAIDTDLHKRLTGKDNSVILDNLNYLSQRGCRIEIRYPFVVGMNDHEAEKIALFLKNIKGIKKVKVLRYHDFSRSRYEALSMTDTLPENKTTEDAVRDAVNVFLRHGINAVDGMNE